MTFMLALTPDERLWLAELLEHRRDRGNEVWNSNTVIADRLLFKLEGVAVRTLPPREGERYGTDWPESRHAPPVAWEYKRSSLTEILLDGQLVDALRGHRIQTVHDLTQRTEAELLNLPGLSEAAVGVIVARLLRKRLCLKEPPKSEPRKRAKKKPKTRSSRART